MYITYLHAFFLELLFCLGFCAFVPCQVRNALQKQMHVFYKNIENPRRW